MGLPSNVLMHTPQKRTGFVFFVLLRLRQYFLVRKSGIIRAWSTAYWEPCMDPYGRTHMIIPQPISRRVPPATSTRVFFPQVDCYHDRISCHLLCQLPLKKAKPKESEGAGDSVKLLLDASNCVRPGRGNWDILGLGGLAQLLKPDILLVDAGHSHGGHGVVPHHGAHH